MNTMDVSRIDYAPNDLTGLEAQLRSSVRVQIENTRDSLRLLAESQDRLRAGGEALSRVAGLCQQSEELIENYPFINQVSCTHQNFVLTKRVYEELCALDAKVERCAALLDADQESGRPDNLLLVYHYLVRLEVFRKQTLDLMQNAPSTAVYTIKRYFNKLDELGKAFDQFYWELPRQLFKMIEQGQGRYIVAMIKVLMAMETSQRSRFTSILDELITNRFNAAISASGCNSAEDMVTALEALSFWQADLLMVRNDLALKFPPSFNILDWFLLTYHRNIHAIISPYLKSKLGPADILYLIGWVHAYHDEMASQLGISSEDLEPRLLEDREAELIAEYVALSRGKMNEWIGNLLAVESKTFVERPQAPETDADDRYMTPSGIDLYQIVKQHMDTAAGASRDRLLLEIVAECVKSVNGFINGMSRTLAVEKNKYFEKPDDVPPLFEDYVITLGNTCLRWVSYVQELVEDMEEVLASEYVAQASKTLKSLSENFVSLAKDCTQVLVEIIFQSVRPALQQLFTVTWYGKERLVETVVATFEDFFGDYKRHADPFLLNKLITDVLERIVILYLVQLRSKNSRLKMPSAQEGLAADVQTMISFFSQHRELERVRKFTDPVSKFIDLVTSSDKMIFLEFVSFWKTYPDMPMALFEEVLSKRDDLDKTAVKHIMENCRNKTREEKILEAAPSIFAKIK